MSSDPVTNPAAPIASGQSRSSKTTWSLPLPLQRLRRAVKKGLAFIQNAPPDLPRSLQLEWQFITARWIGIVFVAHSLLVWNLPIERLLAAYGLLFVAALYNLAVQRLLRQKPDLFTQGYVTILGDGLLVMGMLSLGGGFNSPFHYILFTAAISGAMRFGRGPALAMALTFGAFDAFESIRRAGTLDATFAFRTGFLCLTAIYAGYLRGQAKEAEEALQARLHQANLLNEATAKLGASLEFEPVLRTIVDAASHLFGSKHVVLHTPAEFEDRGGHEHPLVIHKEDPEDLTRLENRSATTQALVELCEQHAKAEIWRAGEHARVRPEVLRSGQPAIVLSLASPTRRISLATLALVVDKWPITPALHSDTLDSFVERITLAIENASLYRTLASRSSDLQRAYADLAIAHQDLLSVDEMKTNFIANVSHELRTPLSSIRAFSELLLAYDNDPEVQKEFIGIVNTESERLTRLVNDVLDISKIEAGRMDWNMADLEVSRLVTDSARTFAPLVDMQGLTFVHDVEPDLPRVHGDRDRLQQVLANLLNNAVKFTEAGSITLRAYSVEDEIHISVIDTGVGIAPEDHERIFDKFQQVGEMLTDKPHGTGLGLTICREIVAHHDGRLWVESELGRGSTFTMALKALKALTEAPLAAAPRELLTGEIAAETRAKAPAAV